MQLGIMRSILSHLDPRAAPIITRLANMSARPSLGATIWLGVAVFVVSLGISAAYLYSLTLASTAQFITGAIIRQLTLIVMVVASAYLLLLPAVVAGFAAMLSARDARSESFSLLRLTHISGQAVFQGYVMAALYRLRVWIAVAFGLIPVYATALAPLSLIFVTAIVIATPFTHLMIWDMALRLAYYTLIGVGVWGMSLFAAVMGVSVGLRAQSPLVAASIAPVGVTVMMVGIGLLLNGYIAPLFSTPVANLYPLTIPLILLVGLVVAAAPFVATLSALRQIQRALPAALTE